MQKFKKKYTIEFETDDKWQPYDDTCWVFCPYAVFTKLSRECRCLKLQREHGIDACPFTTTMEIIENIRTE